MWKKYVALICSLLMVMLMAPIAQAAANKQQTTTSKFDTSGQAAILMDENGTVLFAKEPHKPLPPASVTKIMTLLLAVEAVEQGQVKLDELVTITETAWKQGGSQIWLEPGEQMTVKELLTAVAVVSANDAAVALMEHIYGSKEAAIAKMNQRAAELGLQNSKFSSVNGLPVPDHYMSVYDAATIAKEAIKHPLYLEQVGIKEYWLRQGKNWLVNTNKLLWWYQGADGLKTGWTQEAKYCFVGTAKRNGLRLIGVVFASPEPRSHLRETMRLFDWGYSNFIAAPVVQKGVVIDTIKVNGGLEKTVQLIAKSDLSVVVQKGQNKAVETKIALMTNSIAAPIDAGEKYGEIIAYLEGQEVGKVDLVSAKAIDKAGFTENFLDFFTSLHSIAK